MFGLFIRQSGDVAAEARSLGCGGLPFVISLLPRVALGPPGTGASVDQQRAECSRTVDIARRDALDVRQDAAQGERREPCGLLLGAALAGHVPMNGGQ